jgi:hypothetical protein
MRTAIILGCMMIAEAINPHFLNFNDMKDVATVTAIVIGVAMAMDVWDFFVGNTVKVVVERKRKDRL